MMAHKVIKVRRDYKVCLVNRVLRACQAIQDRMVWTAQKGTEAIQVHRDLRDRQEQKGIRGLLDHGAYKAKEDPQDLRDLSDHKDPLVQTEPTLPFLDRRDLKATRVILALAGHPD